MKRWMGYLLALVLTAGMILSGASFAEESGAAKTLEVGKSFQYAVAQDRVWVVTQDGVTVYDGSMETQVSSFEIDFQPMRLAAGADGLYLLKGEGNASEVVRMDEKGQVTGQWSLPEGTGCVQMEIAEDEACLLYTSYGDAPHVAGEIPGNHRPEHVVTAQAVFGEDARKQPGAIVRCV